jgi:hypothetical protein
VSPRRRLLLAVGAAAVLLGGCALLRADQCREASTRVEVGLLGGVPAGLTEALVAYNRWCLWPWDRPRGVYD